jgi:hypothetical protein
MEAAMKRKALMLATSAALAFSLAGCGGGAGGVNSLPPPPPSPTPTPTPTPTSTLVPVNIFPAITASTELAALGLESSLSTLTKSGFSVRYDAASKLYVFDLPITGAGSFYENTVNTPNARFWNGELVDKAGNSTAIMSVLKPSPGNPEIQLSYTSLATYGWNGGPFGGVPFGVVAFGSATPAGAVPVTGSATYNAFVSGYYIKSDVPIGGSATLQFNFVNGTLDGHFDPAAADYAGGWIPLGRYDFRNTVFGVGSTNFAGDMKNGANGELGSFEGLFTGPAAQELMARWTTDTMFGVWVGAK